MPERSLVSRKCRAGIVPLFCLALVAADVDCPGPYGRAQPDAPRVAASVAPARPGGAIEAADIDEEGPFPLPLTSVAPPGSLIYSGAVSGRIVSVAAQDDFESGALGPRWTTASSTPNGRIQVTGAFGTASGSFALLMDTTAAGPNRNEAIFSADLSGPSQARLRFRHADFSDEENPLPIDFTGSVNGDGVAISDDGVRWRRVFSPPADARFGEWNEVIVDLAAEAAAAGMSFGPGFRIKFQQFDDFPLTTDGRGYDDLTIEVPGEDSDVFAVVIDPGQTVTVLLEPDPGLRAYVELADGDDPVASKSAEAAGVPIVLQTAATRGRVGGDGLQPRTYLLTVGAVDTSIGNYELHITLNATIEEENHGGPRNDSPDHAQDLASSFVPLLHALDGEDDLGAHPDRGAAVGVTDPIRGLPIAGEDFESGALGPQWTTASSTPNGRIQVTGAFGTASGSFALLMDTTAAGPNRNEAIFSTDLSGPSQARLRFRHADFSDEENPLPIDFTGSVNGDGVAISDDGVRWRRVFSPPADARFGEWNEVIVDLAAEAAAAGMSFGPGLRIKFQQFDDFPLTSDGRGYDDLVLETPIPGGDFYAFPLLAGDDTTIAVAGGGQIGIELLDASGSVVARGTALANPIANGSFENGDFAGWTPTTVGSPFLPWEVSRAGAGAGFGMAPTSPQHGEFVAWNGFDGAGPMSFTLHQDIAVPADESAALLQWRDRVQWNFTLGGFAARPREYFVEVRNPATDAVLETLFSFSTGTQATNPTGDSGWQAHEVDLSAYAGTVVRLMFREEIPEFFTGPAQLEIDHVRIGSGSAVLPAGYNDVIDHFVPAASGTYFARVSGDADVDYTLLVLRNAGIDREKNDDWSSAQPVLEPAVAGRRWILGHVSGAALYGASAEGELVTLDLTSGAGSLVGTLASGTTEIEYDDASGRAFSQFRDGSFVGQEFDIETGAPIGGPIFNRASFTGQEWIGPNLFATAITFSRGPSTLRILDPWSGGSIVIGPTGVGPISGLAYDDAEGVLYGISGGPGESTLYTLDLGSGSASPVGNTGFQAGSLEFGPDGALYGGGTGNDAGLLFRIDPATGASTLVGPTGLPGVTGLALRNTGRSDFYAIELAGHQNLEVRTYTPAGKSGEFVNRFDPLVRIYDERGTPVAADDDSAPDARNALVRFRVPGGRAGTYFVEVAASADNRVPSGGEYLLSIKSMDRN